MGTSYMIPLAKRPGAALISVMIPNAGKKPSQANFWIAPSKPNSLRPIARRCDKNLNAERRCKGRHLTMVNSP